MAKLVVSRTLPSAAQRVCKEQLDNHPAARSIADNAQSRCSGEEQQHLGKGSMRLSCVESLWLLHKRISQSVERKRH